MRGKPFEKHLDVDVVPMDVVQMHDIGVDSIEFFQQTFRVSLRIETHSIEKTRHDSVMVYAQLRRTALFMIVDRFMPATPKNIRVNTLLGELVRADLA